LNKSVLLLFNQTLNHKVMKAQYIFRFVAILALFFFNGFALQAQEGSLFQPKTESGLVIPKTDFGLQLGTSFTTGFGGSTLFSQSLAPHFQWNPGQRFSLLVGSVVSTGQFSGMNGFSPFGFGHAGDLGMMAPQRLFSTTVYAMGAYQLNPRLTIIGGGWTEHNNFQMTQPQMNSQAFNLNPRGMMVGFGYRITDNLSFGAQVNVSSGYNPFNPFSQPGGFNRSVFAPSPFHRNPFW
jgi:hypothetical protein